MEGPDLEKCEEALTAAFTGLLDTEISEETSRPSSRALRGMQREGQRGLERPRERETGRQRWRTESQREGRLEMGDKNSGEERIKTRGTDSKGTGE